MQAMNEIVNARPNSKLGGRSPAEVFTKTMSGDTALIEKVSESVLKSANAKRQPSKITPLSKGDRVRVIDERSPKVLLANSRDPSEPRAHKWPPWRTAS